MRILLFIALSLAVLCPVSEVSAQSISTTQALELGEAVLLDNTAVRAIVLDQDGSFTNDPEFVFVTNPVVGIYQLTGEAAFRPIASVTITVDQQMLGGGGHIFTIDSFDIDHPPSTNGAGEATIRVGARMQSSGTGSIYPTSTSFVGDLELSVNY